MKYIVKYVLNSEVDTFLEEFEDEGDYAGYEIVCASLNGSYTMFVLKAVSE